MKSKLYSWCVGIPLLATALVLIGADAPAPATDAADSDGDGMEDIYELHFGLDPAQDDANFDYDNDGLSNLQEFGLLTDPFAPDTDRDGILDPDDGAPISRAYIPWGSSLFTADDQVDYAYPNWVLATYKQGGEWLFDKSSGQSAWHAGITESNASLNIDLAREILTNDVVYAIHYWDSQASLSVDLLDNNGVVVAEDLFGNLLEGSNTEAVVLLDVPTAVFTNAAVIQLRRGMPVVSVSNQPVVSGVEPGEVVVYEGLLYIDEDGDGIDAALECQLGTSDYNVDSDGDRIGDYEACFHKTNNVVPIEPDNRQPPDDGRDAKTGVIYVDQVRGNDSHTGRAPSVSGKSRETRDRHGPKKTVGKGMAAVDKDRAHTLVIESGTYNENLDISGKNLKLIIEGKVRL